MTAPELGARVEYTLLLLTCISDTPIFSSPGFSSKSCPQHPPISNHRRFLYKHLVPFQITSNHDATSLLDLFYNILRNARVGVVKHTGSFFGNLFKSVGEALPVASITDTEKRAVGSVLFCPHRVLLNESLVDQEPGEVPVDGETITGEVDSGGKESGPGKRAVPAP